MYAINNKIKLSSSTIKELCLAFAVCAAIVAGTFYSLFSYVVFAALAVAIVVLPEEDTFCLLALIMPFANVFKSAVGAQSFFTYITLFYVILYFVKKHLINKSFLIAMSFFCVFLSFQMILSINVLRMVKLIVNILLVYIAVNLYVARDSSKLCLSYVLGVTFSSLIALLNIIPNLNDYVSVDYISYLGGRVVRFSGMYGDPNYYSINVIISMCLLVVMNHRKWLSDFWSCVIAILMIVFVGSTMSKSAFLMLPLPLMLLLYSKKENRNYFVAFSLLVVYAASIMAIFSGKIEFFNGVLYRISQADDVNSLTTGRTAIWVNYISYLFDNLDALFFGCGLGADCLDGRGVHNTYIDMVYHLGILGTVLLLICIVMIIKISKTSIKTNVLNYSVWICIAVMYFFLSELFFFDWCFHIIFAVLTFKTNMYEIPKERKCGEIHL